MQTKVFPKIAHPWLLGVSLLMVGIFMGAGIQLVRAQTAAFTEPTCNPGEACNPSAPLLSSGDITLSGNLTVSGSGTSIVLGSTGVGNIITRSGGTGKAIDVTSTGNYAIVGNSSSAGMSAIWGNGTGASNGVVGNSVTGKAIYGISTGGLAGFFEGSSQFNGNVQIGVATAPGVPAVAGNLTIANGTLNVSKKTTATDITANGNVEVAGILSVNGIPVIGGGDVISKAFMLNIPGTSPVTNVTLSADTLYGVGKQYRMLGYTAFRMLGNSGTATARTWSPVVSGIIYTECNPPNYAGTMLLPGVLNNPVAYRIVLTYTKETPNCAVANTDYEAPVVSITTPVDGANVQAISSYSVIVSASDNSANNPTKLELYINGVLVKTNNGTPASTTFSNVDLSAYPQSPPKITLSVKAYDSAGHVTTSTPIYVNIVSSLCSPTCNPQTQQCYFRGCQGNQNDYVCAPNPQSVPGCPGGPGEL